MTGSELGRTDFTVTLNKKYDARVFSVEAEH
jgi:hypothetical protein